MTNLLIRWTIGPSSLTGFAALHRAVRMMQQLYGKSANYAVCYNGLTTAEISQLPNVLRIPQDRYADTLPLQPPAAGQGGPAWKLYPPRLSPDSHEIVLDNDVLIYKVPHQFTEFCSRRDLLVITEAARRSYSGHLADAVPYGFHVNSGVMCFPPQFDFGQELQRTIQQANITAWSDHLTEQTVVAATLAPLQERLRIIPLSDIFVCHDSYQPGRYGTHFVRLNREDLRFWSQHQKRWLL